MQKIKKFFVVLLLICSVSVSSVKAESIHQKAARYVAEGYVVAIAVLSGNTWLITAYSSDRGVVVEPVVDL